MTTGRASRLQGIEAFVMSAETGSFSAAAQRLGITRSAVAKSIARLEQTLGTPLFQRTGGALLLSAEGTAFLDHADAALRELDAGEALISQRRGQVRGNLRVSLPTSFGRLWALPVLLTYARKHPLLTLEVSFEDRFVRLQEEGFDLAVRIGEGPRSSELISRTVARPTSGLYASRAYISEHGKPNGIVDLAEHRIIHFAHEGRWVPWRLLGPDGNTISHTPSASLVISDGEAMRDAVRAGDGIALLPSWLVDGVGADLLPVLESLVFGTPEIRLIWPAGRDRHPRVRGAIDALADALRAEDYRMPQRPDT
ncbi:LysR family transcriptional regulator [Salipiger mucosus]|uniref:Transcriptional regulator, LysR family n=1 Tax=Salipiger mucosus DSM 16094 TaxID=1123237 RepID=S9Q4V2_9RHOB|nr:LysR family transcriptional regulator [Salipiger mucosus]EPX76381.1 Transcriptional regulator, LysR family [Salipiger mucosus DSM 16094]